MSRPVHFEILANDPEKAAAFYREALGWEISSWPGQPYWLIGTGPKDKLGIDGGMMKRPPGQLDQAVINTIGVASLEETLAKIEKAGGKKVLGPNKIPGVGLHAYCADPEGILFGILQPEMG
jgi:hypothetical protein